MAPCGQQDIFAQGDAYHDSVSVRVAAALFLVVISGCGTEPSFVTPNYRVNVFGDIFSARQIDKQIELVVEELSELEDRPFGKLSTRLAFRDADVTLSFDASTVSSVTMNDNKDSAHLIINAEEGDCLATTALAHEVIHVAQWFMEGVKDEWHTDNDLWAIPGGVVAKATENFCNRYCQYLCGVS